MFSFFRRRALLDKAVQQQIVQRIQEAESKTSGEVRVYMERKCPNADPLARAQEIFARLGMEQTQARNAVIVYVALDDRKFALFGDTAIYEKAGGPAFWQQAADKLTGHLKKNEIADGLGNCIRELGIALATHFPYDPAVKKNELPDEIVFGK